MFIGVFDTIYFFFDLDDMHTINCNLSSIFLCPKTNKDCLISAKQKLIVRLSIGSIDYIYIHQDLIYMKVFFQPFEPDN